MPAKAGIHDFLFCGKKILSADYAD